MGRRHKRKKKVVSEVKKKHDRLERLCTLPLTQELLDKLKDEVRPKSFMTIEGQKVKLTSQRYAVFKKSHVCCSCGIVGCFLAVERNRGDKNYHFNLYAFDGQGDEVLITKDHIIAKANGGKNTLDNYQTMCMPCNTIKGKE